MRLFRYLPVALALSAGLFVGCPAPPPQPGPPPTPQPSASAGADVDSELTAPELPDPGNQVPSPPTPRAAATEDMDGPDVDPTDASEASLFSVQVMSSSSRAAAESAAQRVRSLTSEPVELLQESDGLWRIYSGRSRTRDRADQIRDRLIASGYAGAWTKQRVVETSVMDQTIPTGESVYSVQIFVSSSRENAERVAGEARTTTRMEVEIVEIDGYFKIFVGRSATRGSIDTERNRLRTEGYPDAWTYRRQGTR